MARALLEGHARSFLDGFNIAAADWRSVHEGLREVSSDERGFAYEGAAMYAAIRDAATMGRAQAVSLLSSGPGDGYVHLIRVGTGWPYALVSRPPVAPVGSTPLLRWLGLDGGGFALAFFGGKARLRRFCSRTPTPAWAEKVAGCGRALWFIESAGVPAVCATIGAAPAAARPHLWSGVGLASCYAGGVEADGFAELAAACGDYWPHLAQGSIFGVAARVRSGVVPRYTSVGSRAVLDRDPATVANWSEQALAGIESRGDLAAYGEWKSRLRHIAGAHR
ncbi:DUF1702 family protein [Prauserella halophila]|uniref:DUF1702 family protein n=1 Tax=Prauserella halophila TaxID=185641 RepID=A0ABP4GUT0_9PSEU|nr:Protein of unknown function (DUF1702) [Prauserella halophila]